MAIYGVDIHPQFQAGISIETIAAEGFAFLAAKVSEGRGMFDSADWLRRGRAAGLLCLGYHYLRPGDEAGQAAVFAVQLAAAGVPGMLDAEALADDGETPTLTIAGIHRFLDECAARGAHVPLLYLPRWYWQRMGSPDLGGLPALWASGYVSGTGYAADLFEAVTPASWASYGGLPVTVLQFTDQGQVAGQRIDCNAFHGTRDQLAALLALPARTTTSTTTPETPMAWKLERTPIKDGCKLGDAPDGSWPAIEDTISTEGPAGGWRGRILMHPVVGYGGAFIQETWWAPSGDHIVTPDKGLSVAQFDTPAWEAPAGARALVIRYAAPSGGSIGRETEH